MISRLVSLGIFLMIWFSGIAQNKKNFENCFHKLRTLKIDSLDCVHEKKHYDSEVELFINFHYKFLTSGIIDTSLNLNPSISKNEDTSSQALIRRADIIIESGQGDEERAYSMFVDVYEDAVRKDNMKMACEAAKRINKYLFKRQTDIPLLAKWSKTYEEIAYDDFEKIYAGFFRVGTLMAQKYFLGHKTEPVPLALEFLEKAKAKNFKYLEARLSQLLGVNHDLFLKDFDKAIFYYSNSLDLYRSSNYFFSTRHINDMIFNIGTLEQERGNLNLALSYYKKIDQKSFKSFDSKDLITINDYIYRNYKTQRKLDSALHYLERKYLLNDSLDLITRSNEISKVEAKYQSEKKEKQILEEQQKSRTTRNWLIAASLALLFGAGIAILLQKNTTKKRQLAEQEALLKQERVDNLLKEQELVSIDAMIEGQEKERQRVANELHDDLGSLMATIKLHFDNSKMSKKDPSFQNAEKLLEEAYQKVRGMAHSKNSGVMSSQGLLPAIKKMAQVITETNALQVTVEDFGMGERLENSLELSLFRMVQELVANAIKHADASTVSIQLTQHEDNLNIIIEDNGKGFDRSKIDTGKTGMGLTTIEKRVEHLEGNFTVDSVLGKGTSILIDIPV